MSDFVMPKLGLTMEEGVVTQWLKRPGEQVRAGEPLVAVETDKAVVEVNASDSGVLEILVPEGKTVPVGQLIARIGGAASTATAVAPSPAATAPAATAVTPGPAQAPVPGHGLRPKASPVARRIAAQAGVELRGVAGSGPGGRILRHDVERAIASAASVAPAPAPAPGRPDGTALPPDASAGGHLVPLTRMRRAIAERMTQSVQTVPQFRVSIEADVSATVALHKTVAPLVRNAVALSFTDFFVQAVAQALAEHPHVNASFVAGTDWASAQIRLHDDVNVGLAVALDDGLIVPVMRGCKGLPLAEIGRRRRALVDAARAGRLSLDQLTGGTFTISNLGPMGVDQFDAIVNPPEAAILAVGRVLEKPVARNGQMVVRPMLALTLSADHRVLDGAQAAAFLAAIVRRLEAADSYTLI